MNQFFLTKLPKADLAGYRAYVVSVGCAIDDDDCQGEIHPHHWPPISLGGIDTDVIGLCAYHHHCWHTDRHGVREWVNKHGQEIKRRLVYGYIISLGLSQPFKTAQPKRRRADPKRPLSRQANSFINGEFIQRI